MPTVTNVRQDLSEWQEKHANLVLSTVEVASFLLQRITEIRRTEKKESIFGFKSWMTTLSAFSCVIFIQQLVCMHFTLFSKFFARRKFQN